MISNEELVGKVETAKKGPNYYKLVQIALNSSSPTNAANKACEQGYLPEEQQCARWIRMYIERRLFNETDALREFLKIINLQQEASEGGAKMATNGKPSAPMNVGYLFKPGGNFLSFGWAFYAISVIIGVIILILGFSSIYDGLALLVGKEINILFGFVSFCMFCFIVAPIIVSLGVRRSARGGYSTFLPADVFRVESAYKKGPVDVFAVVSGSMEGSPKFVLLRPSLKLEIIGFPERAVGPNEFYLELEDHHASTSNTKRGFSHRKSRKWRTCTFVPMNVNPPDPVVETA